LAQFRDSQGALELTASFVTVFDQLDDNAKFQTVSYHLMLRLVSGYTNEALRFQLCILQYCYQKQWSSISSQQRSDLQALLKNSLNWVLSSGTSPTFIVYKLIQVWTVPVTNVPHFEIIAHAIGSSGYMEALLGCIGQSCCSTIAAVDGYKVIRLQYQHFSDESGVLIYQGIH
jgi:hypothetical protein